MEKTLYTPRAGAADCNYTDAAENCLGNYAWAEVVPYYCVRGNNAWLAFDVIIHDPLLMDIYPIEGWTKYREGYIVNSIAADLRGAVKYAVKAINSYAPDWSISPFRRVIIHPDHEAHEALIDQLMDLVL